MARKSAKAGWREREGRARPEAESLSAQIKKTANAVFVILMR